MTGRRLVKPSGRTVLVVDDQVDTLTSVRMLLEREGHRVLTAESGSAALALLGTEPVQLALVDYFMPVMNGEELIDRIRERDRLVQIVLQTGYAGEKPPREMLRRLAIQGYHDKSDGPERLLLWVDVALKAYDQIAQLHIAERLKTELLASVSHEFRTPLNVILGYVDLLREGTFGPCSPEAIPVFDKVRGNAGYLLELVEEFLDLSKLEAGAMVVRCESVELTPFLRELGEWFSLLVRTRPIAFVTDVADGLPPVAAEPAKLRVVIQNLLSNAAKFTQQGEIRLAASSLGDGRVAIRVSDTGPGIPAEHHEVIFDVFHQLGPHDGQTKGVGLGLALARRFARMMGGDITVESEVGAGSTFTLVLPAATSPRTHAGDAAA
ncbi:MAG TPA: hybrid sensor histidine kinase/response regulator [Candidatus Binatia bacterium]|nr:hybrid sensor histidine kinase/response regulator [Candidatus Binatia bacterium]